MFSQPSSSALEVANGLAELQELVESITESSYSTCLDRIIKSPYFQSHSDSIAHIVFLTSRVRPLSIPLLVRFATDLSAKSSEFKGDFIEELFSRQYQNIGRYFLLFKCYKSGLVSLEEIAKNFQYYIERHFQTESVHLFMWFAPEFEEFFPEEVFKQVPFPSKEEIEQNLDKENRSFWDNYESLKSDSWKLLKERREIGLNDNKLIEIFLKDDVEALQQFVEENDKLISSTEEEKPNETETKNENENADKNQTKKISKVFNVKEDRIKPYCYESIPVFLNGPTALGAASYLNAIKCVKYLIGIGCDLTKADKRSRTPLILAVAGGSSRELIDLINDNCDPSVSNSAQAQTRSILVAASNHRNEIIKEKFSLSANLDSFGGILHQAAGTNNISAALLCFTKGVNANSANQVGETPLHYAAMYGNFDIVDLLLSCADVDVNALASNHQPPLHLAMSSFSHKTAFRIINHPNIDPMVKGETGQTALHLAAIYNYADIFNKCLSATGVDINAVNQNERAPLHLALMNRSLDIVRILLALPNINVNMKEGIERTPLHIAVLLKNKEIIELLLAIPGIDTSLKEMHQMTALDYAIRTKYQDGIDMLTPITPVTPPEEQKEEEKEKTSE